MEARAGNKSIGKFRKLKKCITFNDIIRKGNHAKISFFRTLYNAIVTVREMEM